jgi:ornithine carbamoyltransferase
MYNLRNHSSMKEIHFEPRELHHLLQLSAALTFVKYSGTE